MDAASGVSERVLLISMPFGALERPALSLGLLKAHCQRLGVPCDTRYLTFEFADRIGYAEPEKAYLAGLLHDIGILVNSMVAPDEFRTTFQKATREQIPLDEAEQSTLGFTHSDSGRVLAEAWKITPDLVQAIELHHDIRDPERGGPLVAIVHLSDLLCRLRDMRSSDR